MKILVACEESQRVTIEFRKLGHEVYSCDLNFVRENIPNGIFGMMLRRCSTAIACSERVTGKNTKSASGI